MTKKPSAKRIFATVSRIGHPQGIKSNEQAGAALTKKAADKVFDCLTRAFEAAGRDIKSEKDWEFVTMWLAVAVFAGRDVGHPLRWTRKRMSRLIQDLERVKIERRAKGLSQGELECCKDLLTQPPYNKLKGRKHEAGAYKPSALRRRLVEARNTMRALAAVEATQAGVST